MMRCLVLPGAGRAVAAAAARGVLVVVLSHGAAALAQPVWPPTVAAPAGTATSAVTAASTATATATSISTAPSNRAHRDPSPPPQAVREAARVETRAMRGSAGVALETRVEQQLRASFDAADTAHRGALTRAQARAGGFGYVALHFHAIDTRGAGEVTFDDLARYLRLRGAHDATR